MAPTAFRGRRADNRSIKQIEEAERIGGPLTITQGAYNSSVGASGGTHSGGGAFDFSVRGLSSTQINGRVRALRMVGFAAWLRTSDEGPWAPHIHAVSVGCPDLAPVAARQVSALRAGRNGLRSNRADRHRGLGIPVRAWEQYLAMKVPPAPPTTPTTPTTPTAPTAPVLEQRPGWRVLRIGDIGPDVKVLQQFIGAAPDGNFGPLTERKLRDYQQMRKYVVDGIAGRQVWEPILRDLGLPMPPQWA